MDKIRERREALGLTQGQLAELAAVHQSQVSNAESGKRISPSARAKILSALSVAETRPTSASGESQRGSAMATQGKAGTILEVALGEAFDHRKHLLRDANAVQRAFEDVPLPQVSADELRRLCQQWLDAAASLRTDGTPVSTQSIVALVSVRSLRH